MPSSSMPGGPSGDGPEGQSGATSAPKDCSDATSQSVYRLMTISRELTLGWNGHSHALAARQGCQH